MLVTLIIAFTVLAGVSEALVKIADPVIVQQVGDFAFAGCFVGSAGLVDWQKRFSNKEMTVELCVKDCDSADFTTAGVVDTTCFCTDSVPPPNPNDDAKCSGACPGNSTEFCGLSAVDGSSASDAIQVYTNHKAVPIIIPYSSGFIFQGCFPANSESALPLTAVSRSPSVAGMTVGECTANCQESSSSIAALLNGNQCLCGDFAAPRSSNSVEDCNVVCTGNTDTLCGGDDFYAVYEEIPPPAKAAFDHIFFIRGCLTFFEPV